MQDPASCNCFVPGEEMVTQLLGISFVVHLNPYGDFQKHSQNFYSVRHLKFYVSTEFVL